MKRVYLFFVWITLALVIVACGGRLLEPVSYTIEMSEYAFNPATLEVQVGQEVTLELLNSGQLGHELMIGRQVMMMDNRPNGFHQDLFESAGVEPVIMTMEGEAIEHEQTHAHEAGHTGFMVLLAENGEKVTITFTVTKDMLGEWEIGCFEQEGVHYEAGMVGKLVVVQ